MTSVHKNKPNINDFIHYCSQELTNEYDIALEKYRQNQMMYCDDCKCGLYFKNVKKHIASYNHRDNVGLILDCRARKYPQMPRQKQIEFYERFPEFWGNDYMRLVY